jgi:hypothetical protein
LRSRRSHNFINSLAQLSNLEWLRQSRDSRELSDPQCVRMPCHQQRFDPRLMGARLLYRIISEIASSPDQSPSAWQETRWRGQSVGPIQPAVLPEKAGTRIRSGTDLRGTRHTV